MTMPIVDDAELAERGGASAGESTAPSSMMIRLIHLALDALANRALVWAAAMGGAGMWAFAVYEPTRLRLTAALGYCLSVLLPILWRDTKGG